jgi:hypothetical protein
MCSENKFLQAHDSMFVPIDGFHQDHGECDEKERSIDVEWFVVRQFWSSEKVLQEFLFSFHLSTSMQRKKERDEHTKRGEREGRTWEEHRECRESDRE